MYRLAAFALGLLLTAPVGGAGVYVACAANFRSTLAVLGANFNATSGHELIISSAATGVLYQQILHGAPFQVFLAADSVHPRRLEAAGLTVPDSRFSYATGTLVLAYQPALQALAQRGAGALLRSAQLDLVIAHPVHAPYGKAAAAVIKRQPLAPDSRLLRANNIGQAHQIWYSGGADAALLARSQAPAHYLPIPADWYPALAQQAVLLKTTAADTGARSFMAYLKSGAAHAIIRRAGYGIPGAGRGSQGG